ncbi:MAG: gamma-glutamyltransferase, partial [Longimicrobiales bacterium]
HALRAPHALVVSAHALASEIGARVMLEGGNAVDAAVAVGFALAVTHPSAGNIGGGGFMVIRRPDGRATTIDFREKAPLAVTPDMFLDSTGEYSYERHHRSHLAVGVPGTVAGLALAHERYGDADWADLVEPAVRLARDGFHLSEALAGSFERGLDDFAPYPASVAKFSNDGTPYATGELWRQPDLARTLARIRDDGADGFYRGETARLIAAEMRRGGGLITERDLARYEAVEREPIRGTFRGWDVISMPPPSSGGVALVEMLNILEGFELRALGHNSAPYLHHLAEAMRLAYRDRARWLADTDFVDVPIDRLTSESYAGTLRSLIDPARAGHSAPADVALVPEGQHTTHYSVIGPDGTAVAVTYTIEQGYGSKITVPGAGFLLNNEMGDFNPVAGLTTEDGLIGTPANLVAPGKRMLSSMTPTILASGGRVAVVGSPGGRTIINTVLQVILGLTVFDIGIMDAVDAGRIHHQWLPDEIEIEGDVVPASVVAALRAMGHAVDVGGEQGAANSAVVTADGTRVGAPDPRGADAAAAGW